MDDRQKRIIEALGLNESDFEKNDTDKDRLDMLEECIIEIAEIIGGEE